MEQRLNAIHKPNTAKQRKHRLKDTSKEEPETSTSNHSQAAGLSIETTIDRIDQKLGSTKQSPYFAGMEREE
jgi:hypothetical protein